METDSEDLDLAAPSVGLGVADAFSQVADDLDKALSLTRVNA
ncbi:hypothetical protein ACLQ28_26185 [Micromonospora sp. DT201]